MTRTAVIAGTATAVSRGVGGAMQSSAQRRQDQQMAEAAGLHAEAEVQELQAQMDAMQAQQAQAAIYAAQSAPAQAPAASADMVEQLQQLADLKEAGVLSEEEFQTAKAKLLGS
jgi:hypothetical protein